MLKLLIKLAAQGLGASRDAARRAELSISLQTQFPELPALFSKLRESGGESGAVILMPLLSQLDEPLPENAQTVGIVSACDHVEIFKSKQRPKKLRLRGSNGEEFTWLVKQEGAGDVRKDARLLEVVGYINSWLLKDGACRRRNLQARRYCVVAVNEITGFIEFVPHIQPLRGAITAVWERELGETYQTELHRRMTGYNLIKNDVQKLRAFFRETTQILRPVLHKFYLSKFGRSPALWLRARQNFQDSSALWSIVGFLLGLGDRHGENILLDAASGQVVHVDFDCLFGKGLSLPVPEIVPFRLTGNIVAALGFGGLSGPFFEGSCQVLRTLRKNAQDLTSILESFIFDPLIEWAKKGVASGGGASGAEGSTPRRELRAGSRKAHEILSSVASKLGGHVNFRSQAELGAAALHGPVTRGDVVRLVTQWTVTPLQTPEEQVEQLCDAARCPGNLSLMYVGWIPWA